MEPRSPFDHHRRHHHYHHQEIDNRYASLPPPPPLPPRFPDDRDRDRDRDFYHHHHHHPPLPPQHERLPPPPPLRPRLPPPPPQPQHPSFQYHPEPRYPIDDRRPTFDFNPPLPPPPPPERPYPPSNRIPFDDRHHLPRILDNHPRLREPPDFNPDVWPPPPHQLPPPPPPPRVSVDNRTIRWDHQPPMSPYNQDHNFRDFKRFVDDDDHLVRQERFFFGNRTQKDEFLWGDRDRRDGKAAPSLGTFDSIPSGSYSSRFTFGKGRFDSNVEESLGENTRWGSAKPSQREIEEPLVENSRWGSASARPPQRETEEQLGENIRWGSARPPQRETEEQLGENIRWGSAKPPQREMGSFNHKQPVEIEGDEMESEHWSNEDGHRIFNGKFFHKQLKFGKPKNNGGFQEFVIYNPKKKVQRTSALLRVGKTPTRWKEEEEEEEEEETFPSKYFEDSNAGSPSHRRIAFSDEIMDQSKSEGSVDLDVSFKSNALVAKAIVPPGHVVGSDVTSSPNNQKRRKVESPVFSVSSPRVTEIHETSLNGDGSKKLLGAASSSKKSLTPSKDKVTALRVGSSIGVSSLPCPDAITMPVDKNISGSIPFSAAMVSDNKPLNGDSSTQNVNVTPSSGKILVQSKNKSSTSGTGTVGGITSMSSPNRVLVPLEKSRKNVTSLGAATSNKRSLNEDSLMLTLGAGSTCNEGLTQSSSDVIIPGIGARNDTHPCPNGISITHEKGPIEIPPISTLLCPDKRDSPAHSAKVMQSNNNVCSSSNGIGTADDIGSLLSLSVTGKTPSSMYDYGKNSPNQYIYTQNPDTALSFDKDLCFTHAKRKIIYAENGVGNVNSQACLDGTTALLSTFAKEKTTLDSIVGFSNTLNGESSASELDNVSVFDKGLCLTQSKDKVSIAGLGGGDSNPCQSGVSVPIEITMTEKKGLSTTVDFYGISSNREWSIQKLDATSSSDKGLAQSKGGVTISGLGAEDDIASHSLNKISVPLESAVIENTSMGTILSSDKNTVIEGSTSTQAKSTKSGCGISDVTCSQPCLKGLAETSMAERTHLGLTVDSDVVSTPKTKKRNRKKKKKIDASDSSFPSSATEDVPVAGLLTVVCTTNMSVIGLQPPVTEVNYKVVSGDSPGKHADVTRNFVKSYKTSEEDTTIAGDEVINGVCLHTSNNVVNTSLEKRNITVLLSSSSGLSQTDLVKADTSIDHEKSNSCAAKGLVQSEKVTVCGTGLMDNVGLQSLHGMDLSLENDAALTSLPSPVTGLAGTKKRKRRKKKKKGMDPGLSSTIAADTHEKIATQNADYALPADSGLGQSEDQASVSAAKMINNVDLQLLQRNTVPPENSAAAKSLQSPIDDCAEVPKVKRKNVFERLSGFPSTGGTKIHGRPRDSDKPNYCADFSLSPQKLVPESEEINTVSRNGRIKDDLQSIHGAATMIGNMVEVEAHPNPVFASADTLKVEKKIKAIKKIKKVKKVKKIKKKQTVVDSISVSRSSPDNAMSCHGGTTAASISYEGQKKSDVETQDDVHSDSLHVHPSSIDTSLEEKSPTNMISVRNGVNKDDGRNSAERYIISSSSVEASSFPDGQSASAKSNVICSSLVEDSAFLNTYSSPSLGFAGVLNGVVNPFLPVENSLQYAIPDDRIESEGGEREGAADVGAAGKAPVLGKEIAKDIAEPLLGQEKVDNLCGELQGSVFNERSQGKAVEGHLDSLPVRAESSSLYACVSPREEASGTSITNSNEEGVDSLAERRGSIDDQHCKSTVQNLDSQHFKRRLPTRQISDTERNLKSNQTAEAEYVIPRKTLALPSLLNEQPTYALRSKVGTMMGKKTCQDRSVSKVLPARASFSSGYVKKSDSVTRPAGPRTWHRTPDPQPQKVSCPTAAHSQRPSVKKAQSTSYIRKGNSLVRKFAPVATTPQVSGGLSTSNSLLSQACRDESRSTVSGNKEVNCLGTKNFLTSGLERPKTPLLPHNIKLPIGPKKSSQVTASSPLPSLVLEGAFESTSDPAYIKADNCIGASENQNGMNKESENQGLLDDGKSLSSKMKEITYVKRKSNQLVASCNTQVNGCSSSAETTQSPCLPTPSDQYYKKNKNQLIRTAPSLRSHLKQAAIPDDGSNSESQKVSKISSLKSKRKLDRAFVKRRKPSKFSLVWTLHETQAQKEDTNPLQRLKVYPYLFPWKRTTQWRNFKFNLVSSKSSFSRISKKLLLSRKRDTLYTRSTGGFSLRKSKVLSIGGSNLKWSKSIESRSKKANEEATLAVAAVERKKREQKGANCTVPTGKRRNQSSRERIFRIGSVRYKMDASKCTLQRIPDEESAGTVERLGNGTRKSFIPKRLLIDNDEYIRIGNGNKLVRDPKKLVRILASEKVRWSLHTARLRLARKQQYCQFFTRFGKCNKGDGKCPYIHDPAKIAVCTKFLKGLCSNTSCKLTHEVIPERMEDCSYFLQGLCTNGSCPYRHVNVNPNASVCEGFLRGYCANGNECRKKHSYVCPIFKSTGICPRRSLCKLHHPKNRSRNKKRSKASKSTKGRYFGSKVNDTDDRGATHSDKVIEKNDDDIFIGEGRHSEYISLDVSDEEEQDTNGSVGKYTICDSDSSDLQSDELDELIKPVRLMNKSPN